MSIQCVIFLIIENPLKIPKKQKSVGVSRDKSFSIKSIVKEVENLMYAKKNQRPVLEWTRISH